MASFHLFAVLVAAVVLADPQQSNEEKARKKEAFGENVRLKDSWIVTIKEGKVDQVAERFKGQFGVGHKWKSSLFSGLWVDYPPGKGLTKKLLDDEDVVDVSPDFMVHASPKPESKKPNPNDDHGEDPASIELDPPTCSDGVAVMQHLGMDADAHVDTTVPIYVVDTGVNPRPGQLNLLDVAWDCTKRGCRQTSPKDDNGHGSHVAGIAAACNNVPILMGPGFCTCCPVVSVKVLDRRGSGYFSWIMQGIEVAAGHANTTYAGAGVINLSLGGTCYDGDSCTMSCADAGEDGIPIYQVICAAKRDNPRLQVVVAAGNEGGDHIKNHVPASLPDVVSVAAHDYCGEPPSLSSFSNIGAAFSAPGERIWSFDNNNGYTQKQGTSMAAPNVAGGLALAAGLHKSLTATAILETVLAKAKTYPGVKGEGGPYPVLRYRYDGEDLQTLFTQAVSTPSSEPTRATGTGTGTATASSTANKASKANDGEKEVMKVLVGALRHNKNK